MEKLSVVIPVYNSERILAKLAARLESALKNISSEFEILLVNDGSQDRSWNVIESITAKNKNFRGFNLMRNYGQHNALLCGIRNATGDIIVTMDDDLQHPPEEIHKLIEELQKGFDVVYGIPQELVHSRWRNFFSATTKNLLARILGIRNIKYISAFRAFRTKVRNAFENFNSPNVILDALLTWGTDKFGTVIVEELPRSEGRSNYNFWSLVKVTMLVLTGFSTIPLRFASIVGFIFTFFGIGVLAYVLVRTWIEGSIPGFPFLASIISIFSGVQLFTLGIFGEYLARIFNRSMSHPAFVIDKTSPAGK
ncbi:MAG: glycosyltransferase [Chloroflexi bacterium]|nr:glycosyltransferase [Chloroflexota bacterium]